jgi:hypothetical protein
MNPWKRFHDDFKALSEEEDEIVGQRRSCDFCHAYLTYPESGEFACWVESYATEGLQARLELIATQAGIALGPPQGMTPLAHWIHSLSRDLRASNSDHIRFFSETGAIIERLIEASADYCARLDRRSLEKASIDNPPTQRKEVAASVKRGPKPDYENALRVAEVVARVAGESNWHHKLDDICMELDEKLIPRPKTWKKRGHRDWLDGLRERHLVTKAIAHHLKLAAAERKTFS